jgi:hypothetical protein
LAVNRRVLTVGRQNLSFRLERIQEVTPLSFLVLKSPANPAAKRAQTALAKAAVLPNDTFKTACICFGRLTPYECQENHSGAC